jgi:hypothetical protein
MEFVVQLEMFVNGKWEHLTVTRVEADDREDARRIVDAHYSPERAATVFTTEEWELYE